MKLTQFTSMRLIDVCAFLKHIPFLIIIFDKQINCVQSINSLDEAIIEPHYWSGNMSNMFFENTCSSLQFLHQCIFLSPSNISYTILDSDPEQVCFEKGRVCIQYTQPNMCRIQFQNIFHKDIGVWRCFKLPSSGKY